MLAVAAALITVFPVYLRQKRQRQRYLQQKRRQHQNLGSTVEKKLQWVIGMIISYEYKSQSHSLIST